MLVGCLVGLISGIGRPSHRRSRTNQGMFDEVKRRWLAIMSCSVTCVLLSILMVKLISAGGNDSDGPLRYQGPSTSSGISARPNQPVTFGLVTLLNRGQEVAVIDRVTLDSPSPGLEISEALASVPGNDGMIGTFNGFPPPGVKASSAIGFKVMPDGGGKVKPQDYTQILLGLSAPRPGTFSARGVTILYHIGEVSYTTTYPNAVTICSEIESTGPCQSVPIEETGTAL